MVSGSRPVVSCIVPCFNQGQFVRAALMSIAAATSEPHQVVVVNDGSTDRSTIRALNSLKPEARHQALVVLSQQNEGLAAARNRGLVEARGDFIQFLDADDMLADGALDSQLNSMLIGEQPSFARPVIVIGGYVTLDTNSMRSETPVGFLRSVSQLTARRVVLEWERGLSIPIHCALFRRTLSQDAAWFNRSLRSKEDWYFWIQTLYRGTRISVNPQTVAIYRLHGANMTRTAVAQNAYSWLKVLQLGRTHYPDLFDEEALIEAELHFQRFYERELWRNFGPSLPWLIAQRFDLRSVGGGYRYHVLAERTSDAAT